MHTTAVFISQKQRLGLTENVLCYLEIKDVKQLTLITMIS